MEDTEMIQSSSLLKHRSELEGMSSSESCGGLLDGDGVKAEVEVDMEGDRSVLDERECNRSCSSLQDENEFGRVGTSQSCNRLIDAGCVLAEREVNEQGVQSVKEEEGNVASSALFQDELELSKSISEQGDMLSDGDGVMVKTEKADNGADTNVSCNKDWAPLNSSFQDENEFGRVTSSQSCNRLIDACCVLAEREINEQAVQSVKEEGNVRSGALFQDELEPSKSIGERCDTLSGADGVLVRTEKVGNGVDTNLSCDKNWAPLDTSFQDDLEVGVCTSEHFDRLPDGENVLVKRETDTEAKTNVSSDKDWAPDVNPSFSRTNRPFSRNSGVSHGRRGNYHDTRYMPYHPANRPRLSYSRSSLGNNHHARKYPNEQYVQHAKPDQYESIMLPTHLICENCPYIRHETNSDLYRGLLGQSPYQAETNKSEVMTNSSGQHKVSQCKMTESHASGTYTKFAYPENYQFSATHKGLHKRKLDHFMSADVMNDRSMRMPPALTMSAERPLKIVTCRKLLILDLNGLLVDVIDEVHSNGKADVIIGRKAVYKRPFCDEFLQFCFDRFAVAIWSSRKKRNLDDLVNYLMGDMKDNLLFCWDQSKCTFTGFRTVENEQKPLLLKELKKVWQMEAPDLPWAKGVYSASNTLLLDDSPHKALLNPPCTTVFPFPYRYSDQGDCSLGPGGEIRTYLEGLTKAGDVQAYVRRKSYFGQRPLTPKSRHWWYYEKIINKLGSSDVAQQTDHRNRQFC